MTDIKLAAFDIDGTLFNPQSELSPRTETALKAAIEKGVHIVLATGKTIESSRTLIKQLNLTTPGIFVQGTCTHNPDGSVRHQQTLSPDIARQVLTFVEDRGFTLALYSGTRVFMRKLTGAEKRLTDHHELTPEPVGALQNILDEYPVNKLIVFQRSDGQSLASLRWQINAQVNGAVHMVIVEGQLEILPYGCSKGTALKAIMKELKLTPEQVMAVGDGDNDIEMLQSVGVSVAMDNATPKLKEIAKHTVASNAADGAAEAIERFVLKIEPKTAVADVKPSGVSTEKPVAVVEPSGGTAEKPAEKPASSEGASE